MKWDTHAREMLGTDPGANWTVMKVSCYWYWCFCCFTPSLGEVELQSSVSFRLLYFSSWEKISKIQTDPLTPSPLWPRDLSAKRKRKKLIDWREKYRGSYQFYYHWPSVNLLPFLVPFSSSVKGGSSSWQSLRSIFLHLHVSDCNTHPGYAVCE